MKSLNNYIKHFKNIAYYPSSGDNFEMIIGLLRDVIKDPKDLNDCFIFSDYLYGSFYNGIRNDIEKSINGYKICLTFEEELKPLDISFDHDMVMFNKDNNYGKVCLYDATIESNYEKYKTKVIYVIAENTSFVFEFLLKNKIKTKLLIRSNYGYGFGGGKSLGNFLYYLIDDLGVKLFINDENLKDEKDDAFKYLDIYNVGTTPDLESIEVDFNNDDYWHGYGKMLIYKNKKR